LTIFVIISKSVFNRMEMNFENLKEVFVRHELDYNKFFLFCNIFHILEDSNKSLEPIFHISLFPVLVMIFGRRFRGYGEYFLKMKRDLSQE